MSRVAPAEGRALQGGPKPLRQFWTLTITDSVLTGQLQGFEIMSQQPAPAEININRLFGGVDTIGGETVLSIVDGVTDVVESEGRQQQKVSFEIIVRGERFYFSQGVLSADGSQITGGSIDSNSHSSEPEGTWSATALPGPTTDRPGKRKGQTGRHHR